MSLPSAEDLVIAVTREMVSKDYDGAVRDVREAFNAVLEAALASFSHTAGGSFTIVVAAIRKLQAAP